MKGFGPNNGLVRSTFANVQSVQTPDAHTAVLVMSQSAAALMSALPVATAPSCRLTCLTTPISGEIQPT